MKDVWNACRFSSDVISADFSKAKFAVELHEFLDGTADRTYQDPKTFFENTFLTDQMKLLVRDTLVRLGSGSGQPVTVIDTGFGGGKTHSLLLLHHILSNPGIGLDFIRANGIRADIGMNGIPQARIIEIDCRQITKNTLWGELAYRLGRYDEFESMDTALVPPTDITAIKRLFDGPVLVMLDELPHYLFKADGISVGTTTLGKLTISFIIELISAAASSARACLILTLTEKQSLYESHTADIRNKINRRMSDFRVDELVGNLNEAISRQAHTMTPVSRDQIYDVINARLVKHVNADEKAATIREYADYYEKYGMDAGDMLEKMERSYPFHPSLIDTLHDRVSTISEFNQTRGILRLLARIVRRIVEEKPECKFIGIQDIGLGNAEIKAELTVRLNFNLGTVIDVDCVKHSQEADRKRSVDVVAPIAAAVMLFSLHGHTKKSGIRRGHIKAAVGHPGLDPSLIDKALEEDVMRDFWYIHEIDGQEFYFDEFPNVNAIIYEHRKFVSNADIDDEVAQAMRPLLPSDAFKRILWESNDHKDDGSLKLFVASHAADLSGEKGDRCMTDVLNSAGGMIRKYKNTIAMVYAEPELVHMMLGTARTLVAIKKAKGDERVKPDKAFMKQMAAKESDAKTQLAVDCRMAYSNVMYPSGNRIRRSQIQFGESKETTISGAVVELLKSQGKMVERISPDGLEVKDEPTSILQLYNGFKEDMSKPFLLDEASFSDAVKKGTREGTFGFCMEIELIDGRYVAMTGRECFDWDGYLVNAGMTVQKTPQPPEEPPEGPEEKPGQTFRYSLHHDDFAQIRRFVNRTATFNLDDGWKASRKEFEATVRIGDMRLKLNSSLADHAPLKEMLNFMSNKNPSGTADITVVSNTSLDEFFSMNDLEECVQ